MAILGPSQEGRQRPACPVRAAAAGTLRSGALAARALPLRFSEPFVNFDTPGQAEGCGSKQSHRLYPNHGDFDVPPQSSVLISMHRSFNDARWHLMQTQTGTDERGHIESVYRGRVLSAAGIGHIFKVCWAHLQGLDNSYWSRGEARGLQAQTIEVPRFHVECGRHKFELLEQRISFYVFTK